MALPKALLLDVDNTVYAYPPCQAAGLDAAKKILPASWQQPDRFEEEYAKARSEVGKQIPAHGASHCRLLYFKWLIENKVGHSDLPLALKLHDVFWRGYFSAMRADEHCLSTLEELKRAGVKLAWVTNFTTERQVQKLDAIGMVRLADFLVTSEEAGADKPSPQAFLLALKKLRLNPADVVMVGDDWENDIVAAQKLGIRPIWRRRDDPKQVSVESFEKWTDLKSLL